MQVIDIPQGSDEWHEFRRGKITGTRLGDVWSARAYTKDDIVKVLEELGEDYKKSSTKAVLEDMLTDEAKTELARQSPRKLGFYETIAERLSIPPDDENRMERGLRLEEEAAQAFMEKFADQVTEHEPQIAGCWVSDDDPRIINSPDLPLLHKPTGLFTRCLEIKCLSPARHIQAIVENRVPDEYESQKIQYFIVNPDLEILYFVFYDPRFASIPLHVVTVTREELGDKIETYKQFQIEQLKFMDEIVERLAF